MTHCTLAYNQLSVSPPMQGIGIVIITRTPETPVPSNMDFNYGLISDHSGSPGDAAVHVKADSSMTFNSAMVANNGTDTTGAGTIAGLGTVTGVADVFYNAPGSPAYDYHLSGSSPAIGAGGGSLTPLDIDQENRDDAPDLGADEFGSAIFFDGFESGDTSKWSSSVS